MCIFIIFGVPGHSQKKALPLLTRAVEGGGPKVPLTYFSEMVREPFVAGKRNSVIFEGINERVECRNNFENRSNIFRLIGFQSQTYILKSS